MTFNTKFDKNDTIYFIMQVGKIGECEIFIGIINSIFVTYDAYNKTNKSYNVTCKSNNSRYSIDEKYLFKNVKEISSLFNENVRSFLDKERKNLTNNTISSTIDDDDLPF